jgi:hypothetical protein
LRRALALWETDGEDESLRGSRSLTHVALARAFLSRGRHAAALVCLERARADGAPDALVEPIRAQAHAVVGAPWDALRAHLEGA